MNKWLFLILLCLTACSKDKAPTKLYISDMSSLSSFEQNQIKEAIILLNEGAGVDYFGFSGNRPIILKSVNLDGTDSGYSKPQTFVCEIFIDSNSDLIRSDPELLQYIFIHELGHCFGLPYSSDPTSVMYPTFNGVWDMATKDKLKIFSKELYNLSK